jgi:CHAD domain-containing protein
MKSSVKPRHFTGARAASLLDSLDVQLRQTLKAPDSEQVHDLRVATRRFIQALVILESSSRGGVRRIRQELKPVMHRSGEVRDFDIVLKILSESDAPAAVKIAGRIKAKRAKSAAKLSQTLRKLVARKTISKWRSKLAPSRETQTVAGIKLRGGHADKKAVLRTAESFFDRGDKAYKSNESKDSRPKHSARNLHRLRIATKKLRYTLELALRPDGTHARKRDQVEELQSDLGHIHDYDAVTAILSKERGAKHLLRPHAKKQRSRLTKFQQYWKREFHGKKNRAAWMARITAFADTLLAGAPGDDAIVHASRRESRRPPGGATVR